MNKLSVLINELIKKHEASRSTIDPIIEVVHRGRIYEIRDVKLCDEGKLVKIILEDEI